MTSGHVPHLDHAVVTALRKLAPKYIDGERECVYVCVSEREREREREERGERREEREIVCV
jgi:hypothetical protein